jgi:hypothetical protein
METVLRRVNDFVDDDLLSCFLWAAGENAVATPGWESPSVNPLKGIPLPPSMPPLPPPAGQGGGSSLPPLPMPASSSMPPPPLPAKRPAPAPPGKDIDDDDDDDDGLGGIRDADDDDIDAISKMSGVPLTKEQKLTQRMQRKAVSARVARLRKKDYVTGLEEQIKELTEQVAKLRETNGAAGGAAAPKPAVQVAPAVQEPALREEGERELSHMGQLLQQPQVDRLEVNATVEKYVANKRAQQRMVSEYLDSIEDILSPAAPLQVAFNPETCAVRHANTPRPPLIPTACCRPLPTQTHHVRHSYPRRVAAPSHASQGRAFACRLSQGLGRRLCRLRGGGVGAPL